ncbi:hypothetical protein HZC27_02135 [Candidatus Roizmanbacteria bacterium]|nr:hypothetical protein [Candidatus Roizmanbacteria bacterium]
MTAQQENNPVNPEIAERQAAADQKTGQQLAEELLRMAAKAEEIKKTINDSIKKGEKVSDALEGFKDNKSTPKGKATDVKNMVQEVLLAVKGGKVVSSEAQTATDSSSDFAQTALKQLSSKMGNVGDVTESSSPYFYELISDIIKGEVKDNASLEAEFKKIGNLKTASPDLYKKVQDAMVQTVLSSSNISEQEAKQKFDVAPPPIPEQPAQKKDEIIQKQDEAEQKTDVSKLTEKVEKLTDQIGGQSRDPFEDIWGQYFSNYFNSTGDKVLVRAIFDPEVFKTYIDESKGEVAKKMGVDKSNDDVGMKVSKDIESKIVNLFGKLYKRLDHERASEFFEQIEQQDIMRGILPAKNILKQRLLQLANGQSDEESFGLYRDGELASGTKEIPFKDKEGNTVYKPRVIISPYPRPEPSSVSDFVHFLDQKIDTYIDARRYFHDARAIFLHPVDKDKGFYAQLAGFSERMTTVDFDQVFLLPDANIFQDALDIYEKHVDEMFAKNDWIHAPTMFQQKLGEVRSQLENDVLKQLKLVYKDEDMDEARLEAAVTMAVGASRGMFLTEIEKAALADPAVNEDGSIAYSSYYNNDTSALTPFNPMHKFFRFQGPTTTDPILYMPVGGKDFKGSVFSDHRELYKKMQGYKDSYINGRGGKNSDLNEGEVLFADFLENIGKVGGPLQRKGWRTTYMLQPLYYKDTAGISEGKQTSEIFDFCKTWKRFENIGYEVVQDFVTKLKPDFQGAYEGGKGLANGRYVIQKKELFDYIYTRYFNNTADGDVNHYLKGIRSEMEKNVWQDIKAGKPAPDDIEAEIETRTTMLFLNRTLARLVAQRIPSKILRVDRGRLSKDGVSKWRKIAEEMFSVKEFGDQRTEKFDVVVKDLMFAEQLLRNKVSTQMREIKKLPESEHYKLGEVPYELTQQTARSLLKEKGYTDDQIQNVCTLLGKIEAHYTHGKDGTKYLDGTLLNMVQAGDTVKKEYKYTFGLEELDLSFIPWRAGGNRMLPRAISDISDVEKNVAGEIMKFPDALRKMAIDGKHDIGPVLEILEKVYGSLIGIINPDYAHRMVHHMAALTMQYYKKDSQARWAYGLFGFGRKNSLAAERAGGTSRVWEWDSTDIDRFCVALESRNLLPRSPHNPSNPKPSYAPVYINVPFLNRAIKLPDIFKKRKPDFEWSIKNLRDQFGGNWKDITFDYINRYLPLVIAWLLWKYIQDAQKEAEGKKK